jgi:putative chitobiose transport system permease protein
LVAAVLTGRSERRSAGAWWIPYVFMLPALLVLGVFVVWAFAQVVMLSFMRVDLFAPEGGLWAGSRFIGLANYSRALGSDRFWWCLVNSIAYLLVTPVLVMVSLFAALTVTSGVRGMTTVRVLLFLPVVTPTIVASIAWQVLFREDGGVFNVVLGRLGWAPVPWLTGYPWVLVTAMTVTLWKGFGYFMLVFVAALMAVPEELQEAARLDGASRFRAFWEVTLPSIRPVILLVATVSSISALKVFDEIYVTVKGINTTSKTVVPLMFDTAFNQGDFGLASAVGVLLFLVILAFSVVNLRLTRRV